MEQVGRGVKKRIEELERKIAALEARPVYVPVYIGQQPHYQQPYFQPQYPYYRPWWSNNSPTAAGGDVTVAAPAPSIGASFIIGGMQ